MKVKFIFSYFLLDLDDIPYMAWIKMRNIASKLPKYKKDYTVLHNIKKHITIICLNKLKQVTT